MCNVMIGQLKIKWYQGSGFESGDSGVAGEQVSFFGFVRCNHAFK